MTANASLAAQGAQVLDGHVDPRCYYPSPTHDEALARMHYLVEERLRLGLLLGPPGCGKSLLLARLAGELRATGALTVRQSLLGVDVQEFLHELATQLLLNPKREMPLAELWRRITDRLAEQRYQHASTVLLLDDTHEASPEVLTAVGRLAQHDPSPEARLTLVLACEQRHAARLGERLLGRCSLKIDIEPWDRDDTLDFLEHAIALLQQEDGAASGRQADVFSEPAIDKLFELSGGVPRRVSQLARWSMLAGAGLGLGEIDDETVVAAAEELGVSCT
jgi:type II secretory pathway predicted ATPase ExeA